MEIVLSAAITFFILLWLFFRENPKTCCILTPVASFTGSILLESKIQPHTAYQKQQVHFVICSIFEIMLVSRKGSVIMIIAFFFTIGDSNCVVRGRQLRSST